MEESPEIGEGHNTTFFREVDARIGRWWSRDPYNQFHSPYLLNGNDPISILDPSGGWGGRRKAKAFADANGISHDKIYKDGNGNFGIDVGTVTYNSDGLMIMLK